MQEWGPLGALAGTWEGNDGLDIAYHNAKGELGETTYFERVVMNPFGPVDNGSQCLYGLDYRMTAWRHGEEAENPFHTEVGYWLWDAADQQVLRCFMVPRGTSLIAGATVEANARRFTLEASPGQSCYGILENRYLGSKASTRRYAVTIDVGDGEWSYESLTVIQLAATGGEIDHTDRNRLVRVSPAS